jgi:hypothetical protein
MATRKKKSDLTGITTMVNEVTVVKGSHLTVTTYPDGRTKLEWDDAALQRDCQEAIASLSVTPKTKRKSKE